MEKYNGKKHCREAKLTSVTTKDKPSDQLKRGSTTNKLPTWFCWRSDQNGRNWQGYSPHSANMTNFRFLRCLALLFMMLVRSLSWAYWVRCTNQYWGLGWFNTRVRSSESEHEKPQVYTEREKDTLENYRCFLKFTPGDCLVLMFLSRSH